MLDWRAVVGALSPPSIRKTVLLLAVLTVSLLLLGRLVAGQPGMLLAGLLALAFCLAATCFAETLTLRLANARELRPGELAELHLLVRSLSEQAGLPQPRIFLLDEPAPNALAVGRDPHHAALALTTGLLDLLEDNEGAAVIAHELAHVARGDTLVGGVLAALVFGLTLPLQIMAQAAQWVLDAARGYAGSQEAEDPGQARRQLMLYLAPLFAPLIRLVLPRRCDYAADAAAATVQGPLPLARALRKLDEAIPLGPPLDADPAIYHLFTADPAPHWTFGWLFSPRPPVDDRVQRLHRLPDLQSAAG